MGVAESGAGELRQRLENELGKDIVSLRLVARSSNIVYDVRTAGSRYSVRIRHLESLSAFWRMLERVFGHRYRSGDVTPVLDLLSRSSLKVPTLVCTFSWRGAAAQVLTWVEGRPWEPDAFPRSREVHLQLGRFLGAMHSDRRDGFGRIGASSEAPSHYVERANASMAETIARNWPEDVDVARFFREEIRNRDGVAEWFAPVMPDISANQFVYEDDRIAALVDFDAYVVGPRELELAVVEATLTDGAAFAEGYEEYQPLPRFSRFRSYHRFMMFLNDPEEGRTLDEAMQTGILFE